MEEYVYDYIQANKNKIESDYVYIPIFWTNLQNHPGFSNQKHNYETLLSISLKKLPEHTQFFTIIQHDDGPQLTLPKNTIIFGACTGTIPLPLIYEDMTNRLLNVERTNDKIMLASFIGTLTHKVRVILKQELISKADIKLITKPHNEWANNIETSAAEIFIEITLQSKFCLAPRGYGRSSFRFFEAMLLDCVPVYVWDDIEWLPYKDVLDYSKFAISIHSNDIGQVYEILKSISNENYQSMVEELKRVRHHFTLEGMSEYIINKIKV